MSATATLAAPAAAQAPRPASLTARHRIAAFIADDVSAAALRTGLEDAAQTLDLKRGNIRDAIRLLETDTERHSVVADLTGVADPIAAIEDLARVCPADVPVAAGYCWSTAGGDDRLMECDVLVRRDERRRGVGTRLLRAICAETLREGRSLLTWSTLSA